MEKKYKKILVVDDEPDSLMTLSMALKSLGYNVVGALNGEEGLKIFREEKPDIVILDIVMPLMDGWEVLKRIKSGFKSRRVPVILITGKSAETDKWKRYKYKADFYVTKPYDLKKLLFTIQDMLSE
jgi:two-component system, OmpR family, alkaline phosphatase synthesis response regulator PhoP